VQKHSGWRGVLADHLNLVHLNFAIIAFVTGVFFLITRLEYLPVHTMLAYILFATLCLHQLEEYGWPGGFLWGLNSLQGSPAPDRFPGNRFAAFLVPVLTTLAAGYWLIFHPSALMSAAFAIFAIIETVAHTAFGILMFRRFRHRGKHSFYFPGNATAWFLFAPIGLADGYILTAEGFITAGGWWAALAIVVVGVLVPVFAATHFMANLNTAFSSRGMPVHGYFRRYVGENADEPSPS
jgi:hypothetical protein